MRAPAPPSSHLGSLVRTSDLIARRSFRAMNTTIEVTLADWHATPLFDRAASIFSEAEERFSRFRPDSELSKINARSGALTQISPDMLGLLIRARELHEASGGIFEPAVLPALEAAGYNRSFEEIKASDEGATFAPQPRHSFSSLCIEAAASTMQMPRGMRIDLGGIAKGYTVDVIAQQLHATGAALINAGGDVRAIGAGATGGGWLIYVSDPHDESTVLDEVTLRDQAIATSTTAVRRWRRGERPMHHLIDPRTRLPAETGVVSVTVVAGTATEADVFAKTALLLGLAEGRRFLERRDTPGLFVLPDGVVVATDGWPGHVKGEPTCSDESHLPLRSP
jgi:thiamine biosynthesis lipoprotein